MEKKFGGTIEFTEQSESETSPEDSLQHTLQDLHFCTRMLLRIGPLVQEPIFADE